MPPAAWSPVGMERGDRCTSEDQEEKLWCEGYLDKVRGFLRTRTRWFRLTNLSFSFHSHNGGEEYGRVPRSAIVSVEPIGDDYLIVNTNEAFGRTGQFITRLKAPSHAVRQRWLNALSARQTTALAPRCVGSHGDLWIEGPLRKIKDAWMARNHCRWFQLTTDNLAYYEDFDAGVPIGHCRTEDIAGVERLSDTRFRIFSQKATMTKTGDKFIVCECESKEETEKWLHCCQLAGITTGVAFADAGSA